MSAAMNLERELHSFLQSLSGSSTRSALEIAGKQVAEQLGFRWFAHLVLAEDGATVTSSYPATWVSQYLALRYQDLDPVVQHSQARLDPFAWSGDLPKVSDNPAQRRFFDEASCFGIKRGITVPIRGGFGATAAFTFASDDRPIWAETLLGEQMIVAHTIAIYFHARWTMLSSAVGRGATDRTLTERELECLGWIASGKTAAETAVLLSIARRTVEFHLENARRKLDAASIAHCVAIAVKRGILR